MSGQYVFKLDDASVFVGIFSTPEAAFDVIAKETKKTRKKMLNDIQQYGRWDDLDEIFTITKIKLDEPVEGSGWPIYY